MHTEKCQLELEAKTLENEGERQEQDALLMNQMMAMIASSMGQTP